MRFSTFAVALLPSMATAQPVKPSATLPLRTVAQLQNGTWFENIAARSNDDLLVSSLNDDPGLYIIHNPTSPKAEVELIVAAEELGGANIVLGIAEIETGDAAETFGIVAGRAFGVGDFEPGTYSIWTVKFLKTKCGETVKVEKVAEGMDSSILLNGMTAVPGVPNVALVADSGGLIARVDISTGEFDDKSFVFPDTMAPRPDAALPIGANGVHIHDRHLYWTNSDLVTIFRLELSTDGYPKPGAKPEVVANLSELTDLIDDFIFDKNGNIYIAAFDSNSVIRVDAKSGEALRVAGNRGELILPGVTAVAFGRGKHDQDTLYVTTSGGLGGPVDGKTEGAKVVAIDTAAQSC